MSCRQNLNVPRIHSAERLSAADFAAEQSHGEDSPDAVPFLLAQPIDDVWHPASMTDTVLVLSAAGLGLIIMAAGMFRLAAYLGLVS